MLTNLALDHLQVQGISPEANSLPGVKPGLLSHWAGLSLLDQIALFAAAAPPSPASPVQFFQPTVTIRPKLQAIKTSCCEFMQLAQFLATTQKTH